MGKIFLFLLLVAFLFLIQGCATPHVPVVRMEEPPREKGVYHKVEKGETLWRIAKNYKVDIGELASANRLPDTTKINVGQILVIPSQNAARPLVNVPYFGKQNFEWPLRGEVISFFGSMKDGVKNKGIDISAEEGAPVRPARDGKVIFSDEKVKGLGRTVIIDHGDEYSTVYAHNSEILVKVGDIVEQNDMIARVGSSGRGQSVLHFEIRKRHEPQNPFYFLP